MRICTRAAILTISLCAIIAFVATGARSSSPVVIRVGYLPATHDSLLFVARELHLFNERAIDVQMKPYDNSVQILNDLKSGILDVGIPGMATPAAEIGGKAPLSIIGGAAAKSAALVMRKDESASVAPLPTYQRKILALRGKRVGTVRGSTGLAIFREALVKAGLTEKDLDVREFTKPSEIINAMVLGDLDAGLLWSPHMTLGKERGLDVVMWMSEVLPNHVCCRQVANDSFLVNRDAAAEYLAGLLRADRKLREAKLNPNVKAQVFQAVRHYLTTLNDRQVDAELFDAVPYTTVSPDLNRPGIHEYLNAMRTANLMRQDQCDNVERKVKAEYLQLAYQKLGCTVSGAARCVNAPAAACACAH